MLYQFRYEINGQDGELSIRAASEETAWQQFREHFAADGDTVPAAWIVGQWTEEAA